MEKFGKKHGTNIANLQHFPDPTLIRKTALCPQIYAIIAYHFSTSDLSLRERKLVGVTLK